MTDHRIPTSYSSDATMRPSAAACRERSVVILVLIGVSDSELRQSLGACPAAAEVPPDRRGIAGARMGVRQRRPQTCPW